MLPNHKGKTKDEYFWDVDWRYAFDTEIFKQHLIDFGWNEHKLLYRRKFKEPKRNKAIEEKIKAATNNGKSFEDALLEVKDEYDIDDSSINFLLIIKRVKIK